MERREALRTAVALAVGLAGCSARSATGPRSPPPPGERPESGSGGDPDSMVVADLDVRETDTGHLRVVATVANRGETERTRTLTIRVTVDGETTGRSREVTVGADEEREVGVAFPTVSYGDFTGGGSLSSELA
jgi:hypothetical protein